MWSTVPHWTHETDSAAIGFGFGASRHPLAPTSLLDHHILIRTLITSAFACDIVVIRLMAPGWDDCQRLGLGMAFDTYKKYDEARWAPGCGGLRLAWCMVPVALAALSLYLATLAPSITLAFGTGDSGELASTAYTLGIAHPTGYPLYTLLGYLVSHVGPEPAWSLNLFSAVLAACAVTLLASIALHCARRALPRAPLAVALVATACAVAPFALSTGFWTEAVVTETRTLALALDGVVLALLIVPEPLTARVALGAAVVYGLALCDHLLSLYLAPACVLLVLPWARVYPLRWLSLLGAVVLGLTPYLYLPLRAAQRPVANWGDPGSLARFFWVVTGKEYRYEMFQLGFSAFLHQMGVYAALLRHELNGVTLLGALVGVLVLARCRPLVAIALALTILIDLAGTSNYQADAAPAYLLLAAYCLCALAAVGWLALASLLLRAMRRLAPALPALALVSLLSLTGMAVAEYPAAADARSAVDQLRNTSLRAYGIATLRGLPRRAVLFADDQTFDGRTLETSMVFWYVQRALHIRPDITIVVPALLQYAWYYRQVRAAPVFDQRLLPASSESSDDGVDFALSTRRMALLVRAVRAGHPLFSVAPEIMLGDICPRQTRYGQLIQLRCTGL